jgi:rod shape-determining protein MreD
MASNRREVDEQSFPLIVYVLTPLLALGLQSFLPLHFAALAILDLPLIVVIYFSMERRSPITGTIGGALMGLAQDAVTSQPLGVFGIAKCVIGYLAGSIGALVDTESHGTRLLLSVAFFILHNAIDWVLVRHLLAQPMPWNWLHELLRIGINSLLAVVIFALLDRTKPRV